MKILAIDTSSKFLSIALADNSAIISEEAHELDRKHSNFLVPKIKEMLEKADVKISEIGAFVIGLGPGSFTGLRIGVSAVKGFGIALEKPCIGVPSIDAMALGADIEGLIAPVIDAKRGQLYSALYKKQNRKLIKKSKNLLLNIDSLMDKISGPGVFLGDGIALYRERIEEKNKNAIFLSEEYWYPKARNLIRLAKISKETSLSKLNPIYLYPKDCQVRR